MKPSNLSLLLVFFSLTFLSAQEIQSPSFGNGILNLAGKDSSWTIEGGY
jgi:phosphate-selective porin OprO and OprP